MGDLIDLTSSLKKADKPLQDGPPGVLLDFGEAYQRKAIEGVVNGIGDMYGQAGEIYLEYASLMNSDPEKATQSFPAFLDRARNINGMRVWEGICGGPNPDWTGPLLRILELQYPLPDKKGRTPILETVLDFLDKINCTYSADQVEVMNEPWLIGDIVCSRSIYWSGYAEYTKMAGRFPQWNEFSREMQKAKSMFWLAMSVTRPEYASVDIRVHFHKEFPVLLDRTLDAIAAITRVHAGHEVAKAVEDKQAVPLIENCVEQRLIKYDPLLHDRIRQKIGEEKWIVVP